MDQTPETPKTEIPAPVEIQAELTPNPNTLKFIVDRVLLESGSVNIPSRSAAPASPLAARLFELPEVSGIMIGTEFITVTKTPDADWQPLIYPIVDRMRAFFATGEPVVLVAPEAESSPAQPRTELEQKIIAILDAEIRPAVARDGGDIVFYGYADGVVKLHLQGACSSCPSSIMTLKMGIENRLRQALPEITRVEQV